MELWDLYDTNRQPLNKVHTRGIPMASGEYHTVVAVWTGNGKGEVLLTLRDPAKIKCPNLWENTCGSVLAGESSKAGAIRELHEETGIAAQESDLILLGTNQEETAFVDLYFVHKDIPIESLTMQEGETVKAQWATLAELDTMIAEGIVAPPVVARLFLIRKELEQQLKHPF
jgi:8-oxo-dGTP diphosphatase